VAVKAMTFIYTPVLRTVPLTLISSQTFPLQPSTNSQSSQNMGESGLMGKQTP